MSTNAYIAVKAGDNVNEIYLHWDGYPEHVKPLLLENYNSVEKAKTLVNLGDLSSLAKSPECPDDHTFENPVKDYCIAYGRDRGETGVAFNSYLVENYLCESSSDHQYYFDGVWKYRSNSYDEWVNLEHVSISKS